MKIFFPSEKQTIKTFVANLSRCKGLHSKRSESHLKDVCDEVVETLSKSDMKSLDLFMCSVPKPMGRMASLPSASRELSIPRNVGTNRKRIIDSDDEGDVNKLYNLNTSPSKLKNSAKIGQTIFVVGALQSLDSNYLGKFKISPNNKIALFSPTTSRFKRAAILPPELLQSSHVLGAPFRKQSERMNIWCLDKNHCRKEATIYRNYRTTLWPISKRQWKRDRLRLFWLAF